MHWFWRYVLGLSAGSGAGVLGFLAYEYLNRYKGTFRFFMASMLFQMGQKGMFVVFGLLLPMTAAIATYAFVTWRWGPRVSEAETRCRKCGYILRGLTQPRCPECGEQI